jgi:hypothetical protein
VINGSKQFITNSGTDITSLSTVTARTGTRENGKPEISAIIVPIETPGFEVGPSYAKLGWHASDTHPLTLTDVHVPEDHLLGERGQGYQQFLRSWTTVELPLQHWHWGASERVWSYRLDMRWSAPRSVHRSAANRASPSNR